MKRASFSFLAMLTAGMLLGNPSQAQTRSPVADTNPAEYVNSQERATIRSEAARLANGGVVLVRLTKDQQAHADAFRQAFRQEFTLAPVYLFSSDQAENVLNGDFSGLEPITATMNRPIQPGNFVIVDAEPNNALSVSSAQNETLWRPVGAASVPGRERVDATALRRSVAKLNRRLAKFAATPAPAESLSSTTR